uniref:Reverse transcriptase domain-containing protein n=1 Tax=Tanacetum cinerariifolium TaxID=118510 RepID=A0A699IT66_TANCI|nr:reverse transcriptase domain-containing protein [Tanacetum cinerariifolium]
MSHTSSAVTYTSVYTNSKPGRVFWGADEELSDGGSLWVIVYGYDGLPMLPVAPPSPDYIPGPEEPQTPPAPQDEDTYEPMFIQPHDPDFMPEPIYPEYIPLEDEHILSAEEQILPPVVSPTAESPGYVAESDLKEDPEEYGDDETEDGPVDYPIDRGDDGDDDDGNSSGYDADDEDEDKEEEEEGEEHLAPANSAVVIPTDELTSISLPPEAEVERLLAMPTPSPSPLTSLSPPSIGERLARCTAPSTLPSPLLTLSLYPPPPVDRRDDILKCEQPPRKRLYLSTLGSRDMMTLQVTVWIMKEEAYAAREAWAHSIGLSQTVYHELQTLRKQVQIMAPVTRQGQNPPPPNTDTPPRHMTPESVKKQKEASDPSAIENQGEVKKLDIKLWNLKVMGNDVPTYTNRFQELILICTKFVANENEKIDKYISGLPDIIYGNVRSSKPRMLDKTTELTND